jgi:hypothetical protein
MPRTPIIVRLDDGKDHLIIDGEVTGCGQVVPPLTTWEAELDKPCATCFPDEAKAKKATKAA